jgi:hypothetical protein
MWEVELLISSKCKIDRKMSFQAEKGDDDPFYSKVNIDNYYNSLSISIQAKANSDEDAIDAGFYFIGQALNYLSWKTKSPFELYKQLEQTQLRKKTNAKQILSKEIWEKAFRFGREVHIQKPKLAMSLGWYRKSLNSEDPIDSFLSKWLVIETLCNEIKLDTDLTTEKNNDSQNGHSKGKIFYQIKQEIKRLDISFDFNRLYEIKQRRNDIAHGSFVISDIDIIKEIIQMNNEIEPIAHQLLTNEIIYNDYV